MHNQFALVLRQQLRLHQIYEQWQPKDSLRSISETAGNMYEMHQTSHNSMHRQKAHQKKYSCLSIPCSALHVCKRIWSHMARGFHERLPELGHGPYITPCNHSRYKRHPFDRAQTSAHYKYQLIWYIEPQLDRGESTEKLQSCIGMDAASS